MLVDQVDSDGAAKQGAHDVAQRTGGNTDGGGVRCAVALKDGAEGTGGSDAAGHGSGGAQQAEQGVEANQAAHNQANHVLEGDQQAGADGDLGGQLAAGLLEHGCAEAEAHAEEEDVLGKVFCDLDIKAEGANAGNLDDGERDGEDQAGDNGCGDTILAKELAALDNGVAKEDHDGRDAKGGQILKLKACDGAVCRRCKLAEIL